MAKYEEVIDIEKALHKLMDKDNSQDIQLIYDFLNPIIENEKEKEFKRKRNLKTSWNYFVPDKEICKAINVMNNSVYFYDDALEALQKLDQETQDILHAFELLDMTDEQYNELAKELQTIRKYRRQAKNFIEAVEPVRNFSKENEVLVMKMRKIYGEVTKITDSIENRRYSTRVRTSLQDSFDKLSECK